MATSSKKRFFIAIPLLATLLFGVVLSWSFPHVSAAHAETAVSSTSAGSYDDYTRSFNELFGITGSAPITSKSGDANYSFAITPTVTFSDVDSAEYKTTLNFQLRLLNTDFYTLQDNKNYTFIFDLWREGAGLSQQLLTRYVVIFNRTGLSGKDGTVAVLRKDMTYAMGTLSLDPSQEYEWGPEGTLTANDSEALRLYNYELVTALDLRFRDGFVSTYVDGHSLDFNIVSNRPTITFKVDTDDFDAKYRCYFNYLVERPVTTTEGWWLWTTTKTTLENERAGSIYSDAYSVADVLQYYDDRNVLASYYSGNQLTIAEGILNDLSTQEVRLVMLEQIEGTPFAHKVTKNLTLPVRNGKLYYDSICAALEVDSLKCLNSNVESVVTVNADGEYELVYLAATWLHAASVSGNSLDMFLDLNESYETFYNRQTGFNVTRDQNGRIITGDVNANKAVLTLGMYEYFLNSIKNAYPALEAYPANDIYGYWGFFAIPQEYNLDAAWKEIFGTSTQYKNIAHYFRHNCELTYSAYDALLSDYGHNYLERLFADAVGSANGYNATYYMIYVDDAGYAAVSDSGSTDAENDRGLAANTTTDFLSDVANAFGDFGKWLGNFITGNTGTVITIAVLVVGAVVVLQLSKGKSK